MVQITGVRPWGALGYVDAILVCEEQGIESPLRMAVDSGASRTIISEIDAQRIGINYSTLESPEDGMAVGIGGGCRFLLTGKATLRFEIGKGKWIKEYLDSVSVLKNEPREVICPKCKHEWDSKTDEDRERELYIPSLLGMDILEKYQVRYTDKRVFLQK